MDCRKKDDDDERRGGYLFEELCFLVYSECFENCGLEKLRLLCSKNERFGRNEEGVGSDRAREKLQRARGSDLFFPGSREIQNELVHRLFFLEVVGASVVLNDRDWETTVSRKQVQSSPFSRVSLKK